MFTMLERDKCDWIEGQVHAVSRSSQPMNGESFRKARLFKGPMKYKYETYLPS